MNNDRLFYKTKNEVLSLIHSSNHENITLNTNHSVSGVYLLYIDCFSDEKVIPIYIGQSVNMKRRLRQHINDVKEINNKSYAEYHNAFMWSALGFSSKYEGQFRACKIFKYLVEHHCTLTDIKMLVLEECSHDQLDSLEQYYISKFRPEYFGFNQINSITQTQQHGFSQAEYETLSKQDADLFKEYWGYGYTEFNYIHAFSGSQYNLHKDLLNKRVSQYLSYDREVMLHECSATFSKYQNLFEQAKPMMAELFSSSIHNTFLSCSLKSKAREDEVLSLLINNYDSPIIPDVENEKAFNVSQTKEYLEYYMNRNKKSKECAYLLNKLFSSKQDEIRKINTPIISAYKAYETQRIESLLKSEYSLIFPNIVYNSNPLGEN